MTDNNSEIIFKPIGVISTPFKQKFGTPRQGNLTPSSQATIQLSKEQVLPGSLEGLSDFSHIWLLFYFHKSPTEFKQAKVSPPRLNGEKIGVFATRSPFRPNNIGLTLVKLIKVNEEENTLTISGIDLINQTPLLDIKPFIPSYDFTQGSHHGWLDDINSHGINVEWSDEAVEKIQELSMLPQTISLIHEILSQDVRNLEDKKKADEEQIFKTFISDFDVHFKYSFEDEKTTVHIVNLLNTESTE